MTTDARVLVLADSDSYVKWGASLVGDFPPGWTARVVVVEAFAAPTDRQVADAVSRTVVRAEEVERVDGRHLRRLLEDWAPDVVVLAVRAHTVPIVASWFAGRRDRPVLVTGVAGIALPVQWYDVNHRRGADLFVTHSRREVVEIAQVAARHGVQHRTTLATLPFLVHARAPLAAAAAARPGTLTDDRRDSVVFAPQALVPARTEDRRHLLQQIADAAGRRPDLRFVVKTRVRGGEREAHRGGVDFPTLATEVDLPANVVFADGPMADHLERAVALVTVSSSAVLEAVAAGRPSLVLTDYGIDDAAMNSLFVGSHLLGTTDDLVAGRFREPSADWLRDNYFHDPDENLWTQDVARLLERRRTAGLEEPARLPRTWGQRLRGVYYRHNALRPWRGTVLAPVERLMLWAAHVLNRRVLHLR